MGLCNSSDIFQAKVYEIFIDIKRFKTYIDYILLLGEGVSPNIHTS